MSGAIRRTLFSAYWDPAERARGMEGSMPTMVRSIAVAEIAQTGRLPSRGDPMLHAHVNLAGRRRDAGTGVRAGGDRLLGLHAYRVIWRREARAQTRAPSACVITRVTTLATET
jgi:hypothetical protein